MTTLPRAPGMAVLGQWPGPRLMAVRVMPSWMSAVMPMRGGSMVPITICGGSALAVSGRGAGIGTIELPRIGITADIQEGITLTAINRGPGHWPNTAMPGALGNVVIAGHRTTYSKPFNRLNELQPGDLVTMTTADGRFDYEVRGIVIVPGEAVDIATQTYAHTATLFACHPPGSARQRIVAK